MQFSMYTRLRPKDRTSASWDVVPTSVQVRRGVSVLELILVVPVLLILLLAVIEFGQILASLKQGGFVESRRGAEGGYLLARRAEAITVGEVLRFVEGRQEERSRQRRQGDSPLADLWERVDRVIDDILDTASFAQLVREWTEKNNRFVPNWEI